MSSFSFVENLKILLRLFSSLHITLFKLISQVGVLGLALVACEQTMPGLTSTMFRKSEFVIGTYVNPYMTTYATNHRDFVPGDLNEDRRRYSEVKAAGFNVLMQSPRLRLPADQIKRELQIASEYDLKYLVNDDRIRIPGEYNSVAANQVIDEYKNLPTALANTVLGYSLIDEPTTTLPEIKSWVQEIKTKDPNQFGYFNLLPKVAFASNQAYTTYLDSYFAPTGNENQLPEVLSYDNYPLFQTYADITYFYNLRSFLARSKSLGKPFWVYPITVQFEKNMRPIDENYVRFSAFLPIAYGAQGLIYFTYDTFRPCPNEPDPTVCKGSFGEAMIAADHVTKTPTYYWVQKINRYIRDVVGPTVMHSSHLGVFHNSDYTFEGYGVSEVIPAEERITLDTPVVSSFEDTKSNSMIALFQDKTNSNTYYLLVVNRGYQGDVLDVTLNLKGNLTGLILETSMANPELSIMPSEVIGANTKVIVKSVAPGEGRLIKVNLPQ